jgi:hypothetical protein
MGKSSGGSYKQTWNLLQTFLDLGRRDVLPTTNNKILISSQDMKNAILVNYSLIPGLQPTSIFIIIKTPGSAPSRYPEITEVPPI